MTRSVSGVVREGVVVPDAPLPEGARVEVVLAEASPEVPPELEEELRAWDRASARALETVERLAEESGRDEKG
jgi:hypothetical protein